MGDITSANTTIVMQVPGVIGIDVPSQLQGFSTDDVFDIPAIQSVEVRMGVDGVLSQGFVFREIPVELTFQADSVSNLFFDTWWTQMGRALITYRCNGLILLPNISTIFTLTGGGLTSYKPAPGARKTLEPRKHTITFERIAPAPV